MRQITELKDGGQYLGSLSEGCRRCLSGEKLVVFVTGECPLDCYYCPISQERRGSRQIFANERAITESHEILEEAKLSSATGASITGGEPLSVLSRTTQTIHLLKKTFGSNFHIHLYTGVTSLPVSSITALRNAGLDELRLHNVLAFSLSDLKQIQNTGMIVGGEIPVIPGTERQIQKIIHHLDRYSKNTASSTLFLNMNELEASETNYRSLKKQGFDILPNSLSSIKGSSTLASHILDWAATHSKLNVHYCPASSKDTVQLRNRFIKRAKNVRRPYEEVSEEGLLIKGAILNLPIEEAKKIRHELLSQLEIPPQMIEVNSRFQRLEFRSEDSSQIAHYLSGKYSVGILEEHPTDTRLQTSFSPL